jgi:hypothetical protein
LRSLRLALILKRLNPGQVRLPAGSSGGGRWTSGGGGSGGGAAIQPVSSRPRAGSGATRVIRGRVHEVTPSQEARLDVSAAQARAAIREVQRHDPTWRPRPSIYEGVEGEIVANQSDALQAAARLRELGAGEPVARLPETTLMPNGQFIGRRHERASGNARTVSPSEFRDLLEAISPGATLVRSPSNYEGHWYQGTNGFIFGIRRSVDHGMTFDVIDHNHPALRNGFKVHQK